MILIKWGTKQSDGTEKDWEAMFRSAKDARTFLAMKFGLNHGDSLDRKTTTYISMENVEDER